MRTSKSAGFSSSVELDGLDGQLCRRLVLRRDERDRLALVANLVLREQRLVGRDAERGEVAVLEERDVLPRDDRVDALHRLGLRRVEALDVRVVRGRAERLDPERAGNADVVDEGRAPGDVGDAVVAWKSCADGLHAGAPGTSTGDSSPVCGSHCWREVISPPAAAETASMIFT